MKGDRATAFIYKDNKVLMIQRLRKQDEYYVLPGGHVEEGETPEVAVMRELKEETSIEGKFVKKLESFVDKHGRTHHIYLCEYISGEPKLDPNSTEAKAASEGNIYTPMWVAVSKIPDLPIWPDEIGPFLLKYFNI
jgi:8-oxo-dGTP diphosphatase